MKYNNECLYQYCGENNIDLLNNYSNDNITRESYIEGKCNKENCNKSFTPLHI